MPLNDRIRSIRAHLATRAIATRLAVRLSVVLSVLHELGWPVFDPRRVQPGYDVNGDSVDFGLLAASGELRVAIIVDAPNELDTESVDPKAYAGEGAYPLVVHTNGREWCFMLSRVPMDAMQNRLILQLDQPDFPEALHGLLHADAVDSGEASVTLARHLAHPNTPDATLVRVWNQLVSGEVQGLHALLADAVHGRTGVRPARREVEAFFQSWGGREASESPDVAPQDEPTALAPSARQDPLPPVTRTPTGCWWRVQETTRTERNGKAVVVGLLAELERRHPGFLAHLAANPGNAGTTRRYVATSPAGLFPQRPDLAADPGMSVQIATGWYLMTNFNNNVKRRILALAAEEARARFGNEINIDFSLGDT